MATIRSPCVEIISSGEGGPDELRGEHDLGIIRLAVILIAHTVTVAIETTELIDGGGSRLVWTNVGVIIEAI